jgi:hypothetical protein
MTGVKKARPRSMRSFLEKKVHSGISCFSMPRQPAANSIDSGKAAQTLEKLIARSKA